MIYILEFSEPLGNPNNPRGQARYYVGYCEDGRFDERLQEHRHGAGAAITRAAVRRGIQLSVVAKMDGDRKEERRIKRWKNTRRYVNSLRRKGVIQ